MSTIMAARSVLSRSSLVWTSRLRPGALSHVPQQVPLTTSSMRVLVPPKSSVRFLSDTTKPDDAAAATEPAAAAPTDDSTETTTEQQPEVSKEEELQAQVKELKDQLLRSLAEQDNTRRIAQKDVESARQFAIKNFAKSLLDVSDNLTRALESVPKDVLADRDGNPVLGALYEGIQLTEVGLNKAFATNGLVKYGDVGDKFDPNQHEALMQYPDASKDDGSVGQVMKKGFLLNKRVLRPAEVGVIKNS